MNVKGCAWILAANLLALVVNVLRNELLLTGVALVGVTLSVLALRLAVRNDRTNRYRRSEGGA